jgi:hypothetical protein
MVCFGITARAGTGMALGWLEKMLWFTPSLNVTVVSMGHDVGGSAYCGQVRHDTPSIFFFLWFRSEIP